MKQSMPLFDSTRFAAVMSSAESNDSEDRADDEHCPKCKDHMFVCECDE